VRQPHHGNVPPKPDPPFIFNLKPPAVYP